MDLEKLFSLGFYFNVGEETGGKVFLVGVFYFSVVTFTLIPTLYLAKKNAKKIELIRHINLLVFKKLNWSLALAIVGLIFMFFSYQAVTAYRVSMRILYILPMVVSLAFIVWAFISVKFNLQNMIEDSRKEQEKLSYLEGKRKNVQAKK